MEPAMLTAEMTTELTARLQRMRAALTEHVRSRSDAGDLGAATHMSGHDDAPQADMISDDEARLVSRDDAELDKIYRALGRLALGEADVCIVCGELIPPERLLANPLADTCIGDQRDIERGARLAHPGAEPSM